MKGFRKIEMALLAVLAGVVGAASVRAQDEADAKAVAVCAKWKERQDTLPAVRYTYKVNSWNAPDPIFKTPETKSTSEWVVSIDARRGRYRFESLQLKGKNYVKRVGVFNGKEMQTTTFKCDKEGRALPDEKPEVFIGRGEFDTLPPFEFGFEQPILISHGIVSYAPESMAKPGSIRFFPSAKRLFFHRTAESSGRGCDVFRTYPVTADRNYREIDADAKRNGIVLSFREVSGKDDRPYWVTTLTYKPVAGVDVLSQYKFESLTEKGVKFRHASEAMRVEIMLDPPDSDYNLEIAEGQIVTLQVYEKPDAPLIPKSKDTPAQLQNGEFVPVTLNPDGTVRPTYGYLWWVIPLVALAIIAGAFVVWRFRRRTPDPG